MTQSSILVTGGAGFIGANFIRHWLATETGAVVNLDKLTYAGNTASLRDLEPEARHVFVRGDIADAAAVEALLRAHHPVAVVNFAAESHVDRSIRGASDFVQTNLVGTFRLLEAVRSYWAGLQTGARDRFRLLHMSTDEVFGSLPDDAAAFNEESPYAPNSPYAASKAGSDHLVRSFHRTYGLPAVTLNCSNNFGPYQFPEKLVPLTILNALAGQRLPVYGDGQNVRDWMFVEDACAAVRLAVAKGTPGETYTVGAGEERTNVDVVRGICRLLDEMRPSSSGAPYESQVEFVEDRPGHDRRYSVDASRARKAFGWKPAESFESGMRKTVRWYLDNPEWNRSTQSSEYAGWMETHYARRGSA